MKAFGKIIVAALALAALVGCSVPVSDDAEVQTGNGARAAAASRSFYGYTTQGAVTQASDTNWAKYSLSPEELTIENNQWGVGTNGQGSSTVFTETINGKAASGWAYNVYNGTGVTIYPEVGYGWSPNGNNSWGGSPVIPQISENKAITSDFDIVSSHSSSSDTWNLAYDIWITPAQKPTTVQGGFEIMIWLDHNKQGPWANGASPRNVSIGGVNYNAYTNKGNDSGWTVLSYINTGSGIYSKTGFNLSDVINDAVSAYGIPKSDYVAAIEFGNEVINGSGITELKTFTVSINGRTDPIVTDKVVSLKSAYNGKYVSIDQSSGGPLMANRSAADSWEKFYLISNSDGTVSLKNLSNGLFVSIDKSAGGPLMANRSSADSWEKFYRVANGDGTVSLKNAYNGMFLSIDSSSGGPLMANRGTADTWEKFYETAY